MNSEELKNLIYLLEDPDEEVAGHVRDKILSFGPDAIVYLEEASLKEDDVLRLDRLVKLINLLKKQEIVQDLVDWKNELHPDLLQGMVLLERLEHPEIHTQDIERHIEKIKLDAWLELNYDLTSFEQVKILNYIFFDVHKFKGNTEDYHDLNNSFLSQVMESKMGNPVSLAIIYILVAQRLNIPIYGVNLPQHFVLGYRDEEGLSIISRLNDSPTLNPMSDSRIMFYINPFSKGSVLNYDSLKSFLKQLNIEPKDSYFNVCGPIDIVKRVLRNLIFSYNKAEKKDKVELCKLMLQALDT
jgi:regulator of sirC expression with transglutaminase-like and TPR domain